MPNVDETTTVYGLILAVVVSLSPIFKEIIKRFLKTKVMHSQEMDSLRILEEKNKLEERDKNSEFFKNYIIQKDKDVDTLKEMLLDIKEIVQENQFTDKKDFCSIVVAKTELMFLRLENNVANIIERNHIVSTNIETSFRKINNLIDRHLAELTMEISEVHYHTALKAQVNEVLMSKKENILILLKEVISDYVDSNSLEKYERRDNALKQLKEAISYLNNSFVTSARKIINQ